MVKNVITNLDLSKASGLDSFPVVVLKNCESELSYILAELLNKCLKESCFPDCWKVSLVVPVFKNAGERSTAKNYRPVSLLSVVSKVIEKHCWSPWKMCPFFLISSMVLGFLDQLHIFSQLHLIGLLGLLRGLGPLELIALDIFTPFDRVLDTGLIHKLRSYGISGRIFGFISSFLRNWRLRVVLDGNSSQE